MRTGVRAGVLISFLLFFIAGIPLWWRTTEVYRAPIPDVSRWTLPQAQEERFPQAVEVQFPSQVARPSEVLHALQTLLAKGSSSSTNSGKKQSYTPKFELSCSTNRYLAQYDEIVDGSGKESRYDDVLADNFASFETTGRLYFFVVHSDKASVEGDFFFGKWSGAIVKTSLPLFEGAGIPHAVLKSISEVVLRYWGGAVDADQQRIAVPANAQHRITFTLMSGGALPAGADPQQFHKAVNDSFTSFVKNFTAAAALSVTSQVQQMVAPMRAPQYDPKRRLFQYTREMLPYFLRPADWIADATATNQSTLHFVLYLPADSVSPLRIRESPTNAYLIPRTGGVYILNVYDEPDTSSLGVSQSDLRHAMRVFLAQLRELLAVPAVKLPRTKVLPTASGLAHWERDLLYKQRIAEFLRSSIASLASVYRLVNTITHMGVLDDVKERVERIVAKIEQTKEALRESSYLTALRASRQAFVESERLYFDPNMLPQLYFPDQHKYAIYVPLFLPILVPILTGLYGELRERRARQQRSRIDAAKKTN